MIHYDTISGWWASMSKGRSSIAACLFLQRTPDLLDLWFLMLKIPECCDVQTRLGLTIWCRHHVILCDIHMFLIFFHDEFPFFQWSSRVFRWDRGPGALVLLPTRELASPARLTGLTAVFLITAAKSGNHAQHGWITWIDFTLSDKWDGLTVNTSGNHHTA